MQKIYTPTPSRMRIPMHRSLHRALPVRPREEDAFNRCHESQRDRNTEPQALQLPVEPECRPEGNRHRNHIVAEQINVPADLLASEAAQQSIGQGRQGIEELEGRAQREDVRDERDDLGVVGEELRDVVA